MTTETHTYTATTLAAAKDAALHDMALHDARGFYPTRTTATHEADGSAVIAITYQKEVGQ